MLKRVTTTVLASVMAACLPALARAQSIAINHDPTIECFPVGKYTLVRAVFPEGIRIARARTYFRVVKAGEADPPAGEIRWFYIEMQQVGGGTAGRDTGTRMALADVGAGSGNEGAVTQVAMLQAAGGGTLFEGGLPKPKKELVGDNIRYYVQGEAVDANTGQTQEYQGQVVRNIEECKKRPLLALRGSPGSFPGNLFGVAAGVSTAAVAAGGAAVAAGVAAAVAAGGDDEAVTTTTVRPSQPTTPPPTTPPPTTGPHVTADCQAIPSSGSAPLTVQFKAFPGGGTGQYGFHWSFGPGTVSSCEQNPTFTYTQPGVYSAVVQVTSPPLTGPGNCPQTVPDRAPGTFANCRRLVTVVEPPPEPTEPGDPCAGNAPPTILRVSPASNSDACDNPIHGRGETEAFAEVTDDQGIASVSFGAFFIVPDAYDDCVGTAESSPRATAVDTTGPSPYTGQLFVDEPYCNNQCFNIQFVATDTCGATAVVTSSNVLTSCEFCGGGVSIRSQGRKAPQSRQSPRTVVLSSDLAIEGGSGQVIFNGVSASHPRQGRSYAVARTKKGENRVEATLVSGRSPGTWRFDFANANVLEAGSFRVIAGQAVLVSNTAVVFKLQGTPGERVVFTFTRK